MRIHKLNWVLEGKWVQNTIGLKLKLKPIHYDQFIMIKPFKIF